VKREAYLATSSIEHRVPTRNVILSEAEGSGLQTNFNIRHSLFDACPELPNALSAVEGAAEGFDIPPCHCEAEGRGNLKS
jgi:hypothetical protein